MALTGAINYEGVSIPAAYVQITRVFGGPKDGGWQAVMRIFSSQAARLADENTFLMEKNMAVQAPFVSGTDGFTSCFQNLAAVGGEFAGFTSC